MRSIKNKNLVLESCGTIRKEPTEMLKFSDMRQKKKGKKLKTIEVVKEEINYLKMTVQIIGEKGGEN